MSPGAPAAPASWALPHLERFACWQHSFFISKKNALSGKLKDCFSHGCGGAAGLGTVERSCSGDQRGSRGFSSQQNAAKAHFWCRTCLNSSLLCSGFNHFRKGVFCCISQLRSVLYLSLGAVGSTANGFVVKAGLWFSSWKRCCPSLPHGTCVPPEPEEMLVGYRKAKCLCLPEPNRL